WAAARTGTAAERGADLAAGSLAPLPLPQPSQEPLRLLEVPPRGRVLGFQLEHQAPLGHRLLETLLPVEPEPLAVVLLDQALAHLAQQRRRVPVVGSQPDELAERLVGVGVLALLELRPTEAVEDGLLEIDRVGLRGATPQEPVDVPQRGHVVAPVHGL